MDCIFCQGEGKIYCGSRDPIEGNKMRLVTYCTYCEKGQVDINSPLGRAMTAYKNVLKEELLNEERARQEKIRKQNVEHTVDTVVKNLKYFNDVEKSSLADCIYYSIVK